MTLETETTRARSRVWPAALFQGSFTAGVAILKASTTAMVVARMGAAALPPLYVAAALFTAVLAAVQGSLTRSSLPPRRSLLIAAFVILALGVLAAAQFNAASIGLYLFAEAFATLVSVRYWAAVGETFDPREAKRVYGILSGAGMAGCVVGGLAATWGANPLGATGLLIVVAGTALGCRALAGRMVLVGGPRLARVSPPARGAFAALRGDPYARSLAILVAALSALTVCADYVFRLRASHLRTETELASLFGQVSLWVGLGAAAFEFLVAGRILSRFGIFRYLLIVPGACLALTLVAAVDASLWPAFALKVVESTGSLSISPAGLQLLYAPLPDSSRAIARVAIDGFVKKGGLAAGGAALLAVGGLTQGNAVLVIVALACAACWAAATRVKPLYVSALDARLYRSRWSNEIRIDGEAREVLLASLSSADANRVLTALTLLEAESPETLIPKLPLLLHHASERVRERAVRLVGILRVTDALPRLHEMLAHEERRPRYEAVRVLAQLDPRAPDLLRPLLTSDEPGLRAASVAALLRRENDLGISDGEAARTLSEMLGRGKSAPVADRRETARLLGDLVEVPELRTRYANLIQGYLADEDPSVRKIAAIAAGRAKIFGLVPVLLEMLGRRAERRAAREALALYGDDAIPTLAQALDDRTLPAHVRYELPRMLRYLGTPKAAEAMLFSNIQDDAFLRYRIALALSRIRKSRPDLQVDVQRVREAIARRADAYTYYRAIHADLAKAVPERAILLRVLADRLDQNLEVIFRLIGLLYAHDTVMRAFHRYVAGDAHDRAYALELLDNVLPIDVRARLAPVFERHHRHHASDGDADRAPARLLELIVSKDSLLRGAAIYTARRLVPEATKVIPIPEEGIVSESVIEKVFFIEGVEIFASSDVDDLTALAAIAQERSFEAGEVIYRDGDTGDTLYIIIEGQVAIEKGDREILLLGASDSFGETSLLDGAPRPAGAVARKPTRVLWMDRHDFLDLVADRPELLKGVFQAVTKHLRLVLEVAGAGRLVPTKPAVTDRPDPQPN